MKSEYHELIFYGIMAFTGLGVLKIASDTYREYLEFCHRGHALRQRLSEKIITSIHDLGRRILTGPFIDG